MKMKGFVSSVVTFAAISVFAAEITVPDNITVSDGEMLEINVGDGDTKMYTGAITGQGAVKKTGSGKLVLSGVNTFSGGFRLESGKVQADNASAFGTASVTNASSDADTQLIFNVTNGVFVNDILLLGSKSSTLIFQQNTTFDGDIQLSKESNFESPNNS
jgi:autotransporter-associated beta strand protein